MLSFTFYTGGGKYVVEPGKSWLDGEVYSILKFRSGRFDNFDGSPARKRDRSCRRFVFVEWYQHVNLSRSLKVHAKVWVPAFRVG